MNRWYTRLIVNGERIGKVQIKRGIFLQRFTITTTLCRHTKHYCQYKQDTPTLDNNLDTLETLKNIPESITFITHGWFEDLWKGCLNFYSIQFEYFLMTLPWNLGWINVPYQPWTREKSPCSEIISESLTSKSTTNDMEFWK